MSKLPTYEELLKVGATDRSALAQLISDAQRAEKDSAAQARKEAKSKLEEVAKSLGFSASDLFSEGAKTKRGEAGEKVKGEPKFAHPEQPDVQWSGRGRKPSWVIAHLENGGELDDLLIAKS